MPAGKERVAEVVDYAILHGDDEACKVFNINRTALDRYKRTYKEHFGENAEILLKIKARYSDIELQAIANGQAATKDSNKEHLHFDSDQITFGLMGDTHIAPSQTAQNFSKIWSRIS